ncbi:MAG TPA: hypothetical protein VMF50_18815 [Candidatus Binataceae bacterium]|nr:hypothetical protein [Candidatus Binataceae bacterium]
MRKYLLLGMVALLLIAQAKQAASVPPPGPPDRWQWLNNTYWYVPSQYLLAIASDPSLPPVPVADQTVYYISNYQGGYFWGTTAVSYTLPNSTPSSPSCLQLVGSVTPQGALHLTFTPISSTTPTVPVEQPPPTVGIGTMTLQQGGWAMENQMSAVAVGDVLLTHWAYMYQCRPNEPCFSSLPEVGSSIPAFLAPCLPPP